MARHHSFCLVLLISATLNLKLQSAPVETAMQINRDSFVPLEGDLLLVAVLQAELGRFLTRQEARLRTMSHGWSNQDIEALLESGTDPRIQGLVHMLVDHMQVAKRIPPEEAQPGDFLVSWKQSPDGTWESHTELWLHLRPQATDRRPHVFVARLEENLSRKTQVTRDGTIVIPGKSVPAPGDRTWEWPLVAERWGMYDLRLQTSSSVSFNGELTVRLVNESLSMTADEAYPAQPLRVYLPKPGPYPIALTWDDVEQVPPFSAISLTPAPEGREDLREENARVILNSRDATVMGKQLRYEPNPQKRCLGFWTNPEDRASWSFDIERPGTFKVEIDQGCGKGQGGSRAYVALGEDQLVFEVEDTGHFQTFRTRALGEITLDNAGPHQAIVGAHHKAKAAVMDVRELRLIRVQ